MNVRNAILAISILLVPASISAQGVDKNMLLHPPPDSWPTHHGDYSARRFSALKLINDTNVQNLSLGLDVAGNRRDTRRTPRQVVAEGAAAVRVGGIAPAREWNVLLHGK